MAVAKAVLLAVCWLCVDCVAANRRWRLPPQGANRRMTTGGGACMSSEGRMDLGQRVYLPGCRRLVCKLLVNQPVIEEQFCDDVPKILPPGCAVHQRPNRRHPDCCPMVVCSPGDPLYPSLSPRAKKPSRGTTIHQVDRHTDGFYPVRHQPQVHRDSLDFVASRKETPYRAPAYYDRPQTSSVFERPSASSHSKSYKTRSESDRFISGPSYDPVNARPLFERARPKVTSSPPRTQPTYYRISDVYDPVKTSPQYDHIITRAPNKRPKASITPSRTKTKASYKSQSTSEEEAKPAYRHEMPKSFPKTPRPLFMTTEVIYGEGLSDPWDDYPQPTRHTPHPTHPTTPEDWQQHEAPRLRKEDPLSLSAEDDYLYIDNVEQRDVPKLRFPSNILNLELEDDNIYRDIEDETGFRITGYQKGTPHPQVVTKGNVKPPSRVSYTYFTDPHDVKTSPIPYHQHSELRPYTKKFSTTPIPDGFFGQGFPTSSVKPISSTREITRIPLPKRTTVSSFANRPKSTPSLMHWSIPDAEVTIPSSSSKKPYYELTTRDIKSTTSMQPTTYRPHIRIPLPSAAPPTTPRTYRPAYRPRKDPRRTTSNYPFTKRPEIRKSPTPNPTVNTPISTTTPTSYEFATPKLNPNDHHIHEFIHTPLDPSALIPGHDAYLESKNNAIKKFNGGSEEATPSKKTRRSLSYTESTPTYDLTPMASDELPVAVSHGSSQALDNNTREKRGRPVFYIPWRDNIISKPLTRVTPSQHARNHFSTKVFSPLKFDTSYFNLPDESSEKSVSNQLKSNPYTSVSFETLDSEETNREESQKSIANDRLKNLQRIQEMLYRIPDTSKTSLVFPINQKMRTTTESLTTMTPPTTHATVTSTTPYTTTTPTTTSSTTAIPPINRHRSTSFDLGTTTPSPAQDRGVTKVVVKSASKDNGEKSIGGSRLSHIPSVSGGRIPSLSVKHNQPQPNFQDHSEESEADDEEPRSARKITWSPPPFRPNHNRYPLENEDDNDRVLPDYGGFPERDYMGALLYESVKQESSSSASGDEEQGDESVNIGATVSPLNHQLNEDAKSDSKHDIVRKQSQFQATAIETTSNFKPGKSTVRKDSRDPFSSHIPSYTSLSNTSRAVQTTKDSYFESEAYESNYEVSYGDNGKDSSNIDGSDSNHDGKVISEHLDSAGDSSSTSASAHQEISKASGSKASSNSRVKQRHRVPDYGNRGAALKSWFDEESDTLIRNHNMGSVFSHDKQAQDSHSTERTPHKTRNLANSRRLTNTENYRTKQNANIREVVTPVSDRPGFRRDKSPKKNIPQIIPQSVTPQRTPNRQNYRNRDNRKSSEVTRSGSSRFTSNASPSRLFPIPLRDTGKTSRISAQTRNRFNRTRLVASRTTKATEKSTSITTTTPVVSTTTTTTTTTKPELKTTEPIIVTTSTTQVPNVFDFNTVSSISPDDQLIVNVWEISTPHVAIAKAPSSTTEPQAETEPPQPTTVRTRAKNLRTRARGRLPPVVVKRKRVPPRLQVSRTRQPFGESVQQPRIASTTEGRRLGVTQAREGSTEISIPNIDFVPSTSPRVSSFQYKSMIHTPNRKEETITRAPKTYRRQQDLRVTPKTRRTQTSSTEHPGSLWDIHQSSTTYRTQSTPTEVPVNRLDYRQSITTHRPHSKTTEFPANHFDYRTTTHRSQTLPTEFPSNRFDYRHSTTTHRSQSLPTEYPAQLSFHEATTNHRTQVPSTEFPGHRSKFRDSSTTTRTPQKTTQKYSGYQTESYKAPSTRRTQKLSKTSPKPAVTHRPQSSHRFNPRKPPAIRRPPTTSSPKLIRRPTGAYDPHVIYRIMTTQSDGTTAGLPAIPTSPPHFPTIEAISSQGNGDDHLSSRGFQTSRVAPADEYDLNFDYWEPRREG